MARERRLEPAVEHEAERLDEGDDGRGRRRERRRALRLRAPLSAPSPSRSAAASPTPIAPRRASETAANARPGGVISAFCEPGHDDVGAPGVGLERHGAQARHGVDHGQDTGVAAHGKERLEVADDARRRLGVDDDRRSCAALARARLADRPAAAPRPTRMRAGRRRIRTPGPSPASARRTRPARPRATRSPGERRLTIADSNAPVPDDVKTSTSLSVRKTWRSRSCARSKTDAKSGERWWRTGSDSARSTSGGTEVGPGVSSFCGRVTFLRLPGPSRGGAGCAHSAMRAERDRLLEGRLVRPAHRPREDPGREADPLGGRVGVPCRGVGPLGRLELCRRRVERRPERRRAPRRVPRAAEPRLERPRDGPAEDRSQSSARTTTSRCTRSSPTERARS